MNETRGLTISANAAIEPDRKIQVRMREITKEIDELCMVSDGLIARLEKYTNNTMKQGEVASEAEPGVCEFETELIVLKNAIRWQATRLYRLLGNLEL